MLTPSQTVGPFFAFALPYEGGPDLVPAGYPGAITIGGQVLDGAGEPVPDALLELWLGAGTAGARGPLSRRGTGAAGFGRCPTGPDGSYVFRTVPPAGTYLALLVFARGLLRSLLTRIYLSDVPDPLLDSLEPERRETLIARPDGAGAYLFDIRLQGEKETVFLDH